MIHKATLEDVAAISAGDSKFASGGREEFVRRAVQRGGAYVSEQSGKIIGLGVLEYTFFEHGFISLVYVSPSARRTGAGESLLRYFVAVCQTPKLFSSTNQSNRPMQALFAKVGFEPSGIIHNLDPDDPELVYYKRAGS
ncbi:MAG TPA: GNAT family N-acetyltransferase [Chthoniobacterales bacterium]|nr:GNAT family N-acetyltransferase [Chthoniobacterales bacterium]